MTREYLRMTPTSAELDPDVVSTAFASLHKLSATESDGVIASLTPFRSEQPVTFEFLAISEGTNEPVEFYYGADTKLNVLQQPLRSIYPASYSLDRVEVDVTKRLIRPVAYTPAEFAERLEAGQLYRESMARAGDGRATVSDGGDAAIERNQPGDARRPPEREENPDGTATEAGPDGLDLASPSVYEEAEPLTALEKPTATEDGHILARPPLTEVEPYGVQ